MVSLGFDTRTCSVAGLFAFMAEQADDILLFADDQWPFMLPKETLDLGFVEQLVRLKF